MALESQLVETGLQIGAANQREGGRAGDASAQGSFLDAERLILEPISENAGGPGVSLARQIGRAKLSSCPSGSTMWKYRSPHDPSFGANSGVRPAETARAYCASTSST